MAMTHDLKLVIENLQDTAASKELTRMADAMFADFPDAARLLHNRASRLQAVANERRQRMAEVATAARQKL